jgi:hypothetical protein
MTPQEEKKLRKLLRELKVKSDQQAEELGKQADVILRLETKLKRISLSKPPTQKRRMECPPLASESPESS